MFYYTKFLSYSVKSLLTVSTYYLMNINSIKCFS